MGGYVDLHCHWVAAIDDGVKTVDEGRRLLEGLAKAGFAKVIATPHMRPGMFDNDRTTIERGYESMLSELLGEVGLPELGLGSEHFFDEIVYKRLIQNEGVPYPGGKAALVELNPRMFPPNVEERLFDLRCYGLLPVIAHPERYEPVWRDSARLDPLLDAGACLLLDVCALVGKYGRASQEAAERLLDDGDRAGGAYEAACSDSHRPEDAEITAQAIERLRERAGDEGANQLLCDGPRNILSGKKS